MATKKEKEAKGEERLENVENALGKTEMWIEKHQKLIYGIIAGVIVIAGAIWGWKALNDKRNRTASNEVFAAQKLFENGQYDEALAGDGNNAGFTEINSSYKRTKTGRLAAYYAGISCLKTGKYDEAIDYLKKYTTKDEILAPMALGAIGDCYMEKDDLNSAVSYYEKAAKKAKNGFTTPLFLDKAAKTYEILGDYNNALKCYKTLKADYPMSIEAYGKVDKYIAYLEKVMNN